MNVLHCYSFSSVNIYFIFIIKQLEELITLAGHIYGRALTVDGNIVKEIPTGTIYVTRSLLAE